MTPPRTTVAGLQARTGAAGSPVNPVRRGESLPVSDGGVARARRSAKAAAQGISVVLVWPLAALAGFGKFRMGFNTFAHLLALAPGLVGDYLRVAYYATTLQTCSLNSRISFGTFFASPRARVGAGVYIGAYCVLGDCTIGDRTQIASHVQVLSGRHQHARDAQGRMLGSDETAFTSVDIGSDCWLGAAAVVMARVGPVATVGAGAVVTRPVPAGMIVAGNPARPLESKASV